MEHAQNKREMNCSWNSGRDLCINLKEKVQNGRQFDYLKKYSETKEETENS